MLQSLCSCSANAFNLAFDLAFHLVDYAARRMVALVNNSYYCSRQL